MIKTFVLFKLAFYRKGAKINGFVNKFGTGHCGNFFGFIIAVKTQGPVSSTQVSGHNADASLELLKLGFSRMVCAREMRKEDIKHFIDVSPLEAEVFVHGALCVCHSGQCLFSSLVGGRSGNRGECAQPCRLPYKVGGNSSKYPLSLKD
ncbi:MAG: U32 family peptidase, partial [Clostridia bacterium]|nr:U32 family peptidase [Clostridia bacterium]